MKGTTTGVINICKEKGFTSHDVVAVVRRLLNCKAGHTGTLDPIAEGVLPVCLGSATKIADYVAGANKEYIAELVLGAATDTGDCTGKIIAEKPCTATAAQIEQIMQSFAGEGQQLPHMFSAVKVKGKKLYEYARKGQSANRKPRPITIHKIEILEMSMPYRVKIKVSCSKGTYIRVLCEDIGIAAGSLGHLGALVRTAAGNFRIENSIGLKELESLAAKGNPGDVVMPVEDVLSFMPRVTISKAGQSLLANGNKLPVGLALEELPAGAEYLVYDESGVLAGIYERRGGELAVKTRLC